MSLIQRVRSILIASAAASFAACGATHKFENRGQVSGTDDDYVTVAPSLDSQMKLEGEFTWSVEFCGKATRKN